MNAPRTLDHEAKIVDNYLAIALAALSQAMKASEEAGYGDQFRQSVQDSIADVEFSRRMLS